MFSSGTFGHIKSKSIVAATGVLCLLLSSSIWSETSTGGVSRSRSYRFRQADAKKAMQIVQKLGIQVEMQLHALDVLVITSDNSSESTRAYSLVEFYDSKEPVEFAVLGTVADSRAESMLKDVLKSLGDINTGTLLNPPARGTKQGILVDIYKGQFIVLGAPSEQAKVAQLYRELTKSADKPVEPNVPVPQKPAVKPEPNALTAAAVVVEPAVKKAEPNVPAAMPAPVPAEKKIEDANQIPSPMLEKATSKIALASAEPNLPVQQVAADDFFSEELIKTLSAAAVEPSDAVKPAEKPAIAEPIEKPQDKPAEKAAAVSAVQEAAGEISPVEPNLKSQDKPVEKPAAPAAAVDQVEPESVPAESNLSEEEAMKLIASLMKQAQEEEKKALAEAGRPGAEEIPAATDAETTPVIETPSSSAQESQPAESTVSTPPAAEKPVVPVPTQVEATESAKPRPTEAAGKGDQKKPDAKIGGSVSDTVIAKSEEELELTITLPEKVQIVDLIELVGKQLGLNYIYDPTKVTGEVMLKVHDGKIKVKDTYALLESVLKFRGFAMTRRGNLVTIVPAAEAPTMIDPRLRLPDDPILPGDVIVSSIFELKNVSLNNAQTVLRTMNLGTAYLPIAETNTLIVTDYAYRMAKIEEVLRMIDVLGQPKEYRSRQLEYMTAAELLPKLQQLASQMSNISVSVSTAGQSAQRPTMPQPVQPGQPQPQPVQPQTVPVAETNAKMVFLSPDERTNRVLMIGYADQIAIVEDLIASLDVKQHQLRYVKEYPIQHVDAMEIINVLNELGFASVSAGKTGQAPTTPYRATAQPIPGQPQQAQPQPQVQPQIGVAGAAAGQADQPLISIRPNTNSLLVNATSEQHEKIELVIQYIDVEQKDQRTIKEYEIQYVDAGEVVATMADLGVISQQTASQITAAKSGGYGSQYGQYGSGQYGQGQYGQNRPGMVGQQPMQPGMEQQQATTLLTAEGTEKELTAAEPQISILETTNSLLVHATPRQHTSLAMVIAYVDRQLDELTTPYVVYPLENQDPEELATTLNDLIQETMEKAATGTPSAPDAKIQTQPSATGSTLPKKEELKVRIIPDPKSYSLIVYANKKNQQWVASLIKQLDEYRPQVLLDCTLVVINKDESFKYDMDIVTKTYDDSALRSPSPISTISGNFSEQSYGEARSTSGSFTGFFNSEMVQALLEAVQTKSYGRVMARPKILVNDNQEGEIKTQNTTSIAQQKSIIQPGTDTGQTITTTDVSFAEYSEGVTLKIKPHISKGEMLRLEITLGRSDFKLQQDVKVAGESYPRPPDILSTDVTTVATVPDGTTIILGGLEGVDQQKSSTKVPILGDIPIVGGLFRGIDDSGSQSKLYVFVKANVLRPSDQAEGLEDIRRVSGKNREAFEAMEKSFQEHQDWPGIKPKPMDPEKVLEEDDNPGVPTRPQSESKAVEVQID